MAVQIIMSWWRHFFSWHSTNTSTCQPMHAMCWNEMLHQEVMSGQTGTSCVVLCCVGVTVRWNSCYASPVSEPALLTWTPERCLCVTRPRWSFLLPLHRAALTSSWCFQSLTQGNFWHDTSAVRGFKPVTCQLCACLSSHCQTTLPCQWGYECLRSETN